MQVGSGVGLALSPRCSTELNETVLTSELVVTLLVALRTIHSSGIVHCDVRRRNVLLCDGKIVICDFGAAVAVGTLCRYGGTKETASDAVLQSWLNDSDIVASCTHDLVSVVRMCFLLLHARRDAKRKSISTLGGLLEFWKEMRVEYVWFAEWEAAADEAIEWAESSAGRCHF